MKAITFVTQKGGSGKSTLCISLAIAAQETGHSVCILEMDRQATISDWAEHRTRESPEVAQIEAAQLEGILGRLDRRQVDELSLGLRDDLLGHNQDVAILELLALSVERVQQQGGRVVARPHLADATHADDPQVRHIREYRPAARARIGKPVAPPA